MCGFKDDEDDVDGLVEVFGIFVMQGEFSFETAPFDRDQLNQIQDNRKAEFLSEQILGCYISWNICLSVPITLLAL